jgi:peptidoglycan hydrolase-like protein with peptidoglycan-binding domain
MQIRRYIDLMIILLTAFPALADEMISPDAVNSAELGNARAQAGKVEVVIVKAQILLDRARYSPGEIDGKRGENFRKALSAYARANGMPSNEELTPEMWA